MLNAKVLLTLAFKKMMYDNSGKMGNSVSLAPALCIKAKTVKQLHKGCFLSLDRYLDILRLILRI